MDGTRWSRAQASIIGVALILGVTIAVAIAVVALGSSALTDTEQQSQLQQAEQALTQFDSVASQVALGESDSQQLDLGPQAGDYTVREDAGTMKIIHVNYDGTTCDDGDDGVVGDPDTSDSCGDDDYVVHEQDLGAIEYRKGDTTLAYQGGGVWRLGSGDARMVSPPEFHYRAATLTFPVVTVTGDGSGAGGTTASIRAKQKGVTQYPASCNTADCGYPDTDDDGDGYPAASDGDDDGGQFTNPVQNGYVKIQVTSEYAAGWEEYFRTRTEGKVSRSGDTVEVRLISVGGVGDFQMPPEGTPLPIRGISQTSEHPVNEFTITLSDNTGSGQKDFANAHWSFYAGVGQTDKFEMHLYSKGKCQGDSWDGKDVYLSIFYKNESTDTREEWVLDGVDPASSSAIDVDCSGSDDTMTVDWMDSGTQLEYMDIEDSQGNMLGGNNNNKFQFREEAAEPISPSSETLNNHDTATDPGNVDEGDTESLAFLTNHYIGMMPSNYDFKIRNGPSNQDAIDADNSFGTFDYDLATNPKYVTYLHVSENEVEVSFD